MSSDSYSFETAVMPAGPQMSNDECSLPHSRSEVAGQWSRKPDTLLNEMVKRRVFSATYTLTNFRNGGVRGRSGSLGCKMG